MRATAFNKAKELFLHALCSSGMDEHSVSIEFDSELVDEDDDYSFLLSVTIKPFSTDQGPCVPEPVIFQVDYQADDDEINFIVGEDTQQEITYGNVFSYMYFSTIEPKTN